MSTVNGIAHRDKVLLQSRVTKPTGLPKNVEWDPEKACTGKVARVTSDMIYFTTDNNIDTSKTNLYGSSNASPHTKVHLHWLS
jgi:hypothetical protein